MKDRVLAGSRRLGVRVRVLVHGLRPLVPLLSFALVLLSSAAASARPGGGHSFSTGSRGGGHSGGGGSGNGGGELVFFLIRLIFLYPRVGVPVALVAAVVVVIVLRSQRLSDWDTPHHAHVAHEPGRRPARGAAVNAELARLRALDPDFSRVLFEDFAYRLFASVQRARPDAAALAALAPYLSDAVRAALARPDLRAIENVVVGALRIEGVSVPAPDAPEGMVRIQLLYEANLSAIGEHSRTLYCRERWTLLRAPDVRSKAPGSYERLGCPNCGAPFRASDDRRCGHCGQVVGDGRFTFQLAERQLLSERDTGPSVGSYAEEQGTDSATVVAPDYDACLAALTAKDQAFAMPALRARLDLIYSELNAAYGSGELTRVRALVSDGMFDYLGYWLAAYRRQNLRNVLEGMHIERAVPAKITSDRYFDAVTLRLFASGVDYTVQADSGRWVSGDQRRPRRYSEYWTLIRGAATRGAPRADASCPNCAAPLAASMAGSCAHCGAHLTSGEFDWVLSKIEQDDVYDG